MIFPLQNISRFSLKPLDASTDTFVGPRFWHKCPRADGTICVLLNKSGAETEFYD